MAYLTLDKLKPAAVDKIKAFLDEVMYTYGDKIHSIHITGTAITDDFDEKISDVNSLFVLRTMDLKFLEVLAPLGKKYGRHKVAAPLIMTPEYITSSLDVFPVEFLNFKLIHSTVYGEDILEGLELDRMDLRHQCERELKTRLIGLRQGYLSSQGDRKMLTDGFVKAITGYIPLFRGIISLLGGEPPRLQADVITDLAKASAVNTGIFAKLLREKHAKVKHSIEELNTIFEDYYAATEKLGKIVDDVQA